MNMRLNRLLLSLLGMLAIGCVASVVAQDAMPTGSTPSAGQAPNVPMTHTPGVASMVNMHTMPATVTAADPRTGIVDVTSDGMALKVHFPQASMANLKAGDKIGLYMAYSQAIVVQ
jgi:Cu/Ag efflux protein CusF